MYFVRLRDQNYNYGGVNPDKIGTKQCTYNTPPRPSEAHWQWDLILTWAPINRQEGSNLLVHSWVYLGRNHFLWNIYIKTKGRLLKIFNSIKYLTLVYIMAKNINYHIYKPQIIFPPLLSVYNYFFEFSHCLLPVRNYSIRATTSNCFNISRATNRKLPFLRFTLYVSKLYKAEKAWKTKVMCYYCM